MSGSVPRSHRRPVGRAAGVVAAAVAVTLLGGACSGGSGSTPTPSTSSPVPTPSWSLSYAPVPGSFPVTERASTQLMRAKAGTAEAKTFHVQGLITFAGTTFLLDVDVVSGRATGTVQANGGRAELRLMSGDLYLKGDAAFWRPFEGGTTSVFAGNWTHVIRETGPAFAGLIGMLPCPQWLDSLVPVGDKHAELPGRTVNGTATIGVRRQASPSAEIYVTTEKKAHPVLVVPAGGGALVFSRWDAPHPAVSVPTGQVLDATRITLKG